MASEIQLPWATGKTVYFLIRNSIGQVYNGSTFATYATANYSSYPVTATEQGTASGYYAADMPTISAGIYSIEAKERAGGSPAETDQNIGGGDLLWDGSAAANLTAIADAILKRNFASVTGESARSVLNALRKLINKWDTTTTAGKLTVFKEDDSTTAYTQDISTDATADPIVSLDTN